MLYCLMNDCNVINDIIKLNYSIINDSDELKVTKTFDIDIHDGNVVYPCFCQDQPKKNSLHNYIDEIKHDFARSKYIFGENEFKDYFHEIKELKEFNDNFEFKYMKISDIIIGINRLKINL